MNFLAMRIQAKTFQRLYCNQQQRLAYEIPDEYHNSFYLANASLLQMVNYFIHSSYQHVFPELVAQVKQHHACSETEADHKIRQCINRLDRCEAAVDLNLFMKRTDGEIELVRANRAYHGITYFSKTLGGLRFEADLPRKTAQGLAVQSTYRNALFGIPMGGAGGGIRVCPSVKERCEVIGMIMEYLTSLPRFEGMVDLIEPDVGSTSLEMDCIHFLNASTHETPDYILPMGKSENMDGVDGWEKASGTCVVSCLRKFLGNDHVAKKTGISLPLEGKTYILQGLGKIGRQIGEDMHKEGAKCVGIREHDCTLYDKTGLHIKALSKHMIQYGTVRGFSEKVRQHDFDAIFAQPCDILILAATERCVTCNIADRIGAKIIVEAANLPIVPTAYKILIGKDKLVIPSLLAGAGNSVMSYIEYKNYMDFDEERSKEQITSSFTNTLETTIDKVLETESKLSLKSNFLHAAYVTAIRNLFRHIVDSDLLEEKAEGHTTRVQQ